MPGYHTREIPKGKIGQSSKIREELEELEDAVDQGCKILVACELSDLYGALEEMARKWSFTMNDLKAMSDLTKRAFRDGTRKPEASTDEK